MTIEISLNIYYYKKGLYSFNNKVLSHSLILIMSYILQLFFILNVNLLSYSSKKFVRTRKKI